MRISVVRISLILLVGYNCSAHAEPVRFTREVAPIILHRCVGCHGDKINLGGYRANTFQFLMKRTATGSSPVVAGKPEASVLYQLVTSRNPARRMPKGDDPLTDDQVSIIRRWIIEGAKYDGHDPSASLTSAIGPRRHPNAPAVYRTPSPILALAIIPGARSLVAVGSYNEVTIWDAESGKLVQRIGGLPQRVQSLCCSPDGKQLLVAGGTPGEYGELSAVQLGQQPVVSTMDTFSDIALSAVYSPDGARIGVGGADGGVYLYNSYTGKRLWVSSIHSDWVTSVSFSRDGRFVASASKDMTVKLHNSSDGSLFTTYTGHCRQLGQYQGQNPVYTVRFDAGSGSAFSAGGGKWIQEWDPDKTKEENGSASDMEERFAKQGHAKYIPHTFKQAVLALAIAGNDLFAASADGRLKQFDISTLKEIREYTGHHDWVYALDYSEAEHRLVSGSFDGEVRVWDTSTGRCTQVFLAAPGMKSKGLAAR